ncbi:MAG: hypothetical protein KJ604_20790 [Gammaproteobacteria bacterium]|nr:hypothetical protein [Gammaproteobacteria bacterium]
MNSSICSIIIERGGRGPYIGVCRSNPTPQKMNVRFYVLTTDRLIRILQAMVKVAAHSRATLIEEGTWTDWILLDRLGDAEANARMSGVL